MIIEVKPHATKTFFYDQRLHKQAEDIQNLTFRLHEASELNAQFLICDATITNLKIKIIMLGAQARVQLNGAYILTNDQQLDVEVEQEHLVGNNESHVQFKGVLSGKAIARYSGKIIITKGATGSNASQENKNILLSNEARAISVPNLEALTNDIQCAHGSAVGQLDNEQLLYLSTRGLALPQAQKILLEGFFADTISGKINWEELLKRVV